MSGKEMHKAVCSECGKECEVHSNPTQTDQFIAVNVGQRSDQQGQDDIRFTA